MSQSTFYEQKRSFLFKISYILTPVSCVIAYLCFLYPSAANALVGVIVASVILAFVRDCNNYMLSLKKPYSNENSAIYFSTILALVAMIACIGASAMSFDEEPLKPLIYILIAFFTVFVMSHLFRNLFFDKYLSIWKELKKEEDIQILKEKLRLAFEGLSPTFKIAYQKDFDKAVEGSNLSHIKSFLNFCEAKAALERVENKKL